MKYRHLSALAVTVALVVATAVGLPQAASFTLNGGTSKDLGLADQTLECPSTNAAFTLNRGNPPRTDGKQLRAQASMRFYLQQGWTYFDPSNGTSTYRCEVRSIPQILRAGQPAAPDYIAEGQDLYFAWTEHFTQVPVAQCCTPNLWTVFAQWQGAQGGTPPLTLVNEGSADELRLKNNRSGRIYWRAPMASFRGRYVDLVVHVKFSRDPVQSAVGLWVDGTQVASSVGQDYTMRPDQDGRSYPKWGLYRENRPEPAEVWVNGPRIASTYELAVAK